MSEATNLPDDVTEAELAAALAVVRRNKARGGSEETTIHVRGEGGAVFEMAPSRMTADMKRRLQLGYLRRVDPDGRPLRTPAHAPAPEPTLPPAGGSALTQGSVPRPAKSAPKKDWVLYAVTELGLGAEQAEGMTRQDLIDLPPDHAQHAPLDPEDSPPAAVATERPEVSAPKGEWIAYTVRRGLLSAEDAANYTKDDLIDLAT
jgi:hypothetical protein